LPDRSGGRTGLLGNINMGVYSLVAQREREKECTREKDGEGG
jgi:hypothetical protein